ncbi:MAG TPA: hypothetical protein QF373_04635, partial [Verrucomicrobiota bacterium]|nr:hypothetical protein [Verrucomicrobiota bacterium]
MLSNQSTDFSITHRIPVSIIMALGLAAAALGQADKPARPLAATTPRVPAFGIELPDDARTQL